MNRIISNIQEWLESFYPFTYSENLLLSFISQRNSKGGGGSKAGKRCRYMPKRDTIQPELFARFAALQEFLGFSNFVPSISTFHQSLHQLSCFEKNS